MKVKELLAKLQQMDPDLEVIGYAEEPELVLEKHYFRLFQVIDVTAMEGVTRRTDDRAPTITFGKDDHSVKLVALEIASTF